jgi:hypothetical protein
MILFPIYFNILEDNGVIREEGNWSDTANSFFCKGFKQTLLGVHF